MTAPKCDPHTRPDCFPPVLLQLLAPARQGMGGGPSKRERSMHGLRNAVPEYTFQPCRLRSRSGISRGEHSHAWKRG
jgi:hypothetical protein